MSKNRNKYRTISLVATHLEKVQWATGGQSWRVHDPDMDQMFLAKEGYRVNKLSSKIGLYRNRKPRVEIC
jgi:hypothetical protein